MRYQDRDSFVKTKIALHVSSVYYFSLCKILTLHGKQFFKFQSSVYPLLIRLTPFLWLFLHRNFQELWQWNLSSVATSDKALCPFQRSQKALCLFQPVYHLGWSNHVFRTRISKSLADFHNSAKMESVHDISTQIAPNFTGLWEEAKRNKWSDSYVPKHYTS